MNKHILNTEIQVFISEKLFTNVNALILKGSPFTEVTVKELVNQIQAKQKALEKLPTWASCKSIYYPEKISIEQTSSEITALYKSTLVKGNSIIDITGGFCIDAYFFAKKFKKVVHCEINKSLSNIVNYNYKQLEIHNITTVADNGIDYLKTITDTNFDCIYIDPSRRNDYKGKVFLLKDCLPNVPDNLDFLFSKSNTILIKNSPILDITATINELNFVKEIHIIAVKNEVKELLFLLEKEYTENNITIKTVNLLKNNKHVFNFKYNQKVIANYSQPLTYLYEPNAAILKAGAFNEIAIEFNINKLHQHSHLYTSKEFINNFPGRNFLIKEVINYDKKKLSKLIPEKKANITTRNFPKTVAQIRKETKLKDGGDWYLFFTKTEDNKNKVIICKQLFNK